MHLSFPQSFTLDCDNLSQILELIADKPYTTNNAIADATGIGIGKSSKHGKVQPMLDYAIYGGLLKVEGKGTERTLALTEVGQVVLEQDKWLKKPLTQWVLHYHLTREGSPAAAWTFFAHDFLATCAEFTLTTFKAALHEQFPQVKVDSIFPDAMLGTYTSSNGLGRLGLLCAVKRNVYELGHPDFPNDYAAAYLLSEIWAAKHPQDIMTATANLHQRGHLATTVRLSGSDLQTTLDRLTKLGIIDQMREVPPYQIVRPHSSRTELLRRAYRE